MAEPQGATIIWPTGRADVLYERFKKRIIDRDWPPGRPLNISRLADEYGVSITPVREALSRLCADHLVVSLPNRGYTVAPLPSAARLAELCGVRQLLEPHAARGAAQRITPRDLDVLRAIHASIAALGTEVNDDGMHTFVALNRDFHQHIFRINGSSVLAELYGGLNYHALVGHVHHSYGLPDLPEIVAEHGAILAALAAGDPEAAEAAMRRHIDRGSRRLIDVYRDPNDETEHAPRPRRAASIL